jgi:hypothetical protein
VFAVGGYIRVFQDVRGKYGSEGEYFMTRPLRGPLNSTNTDNSTDAYDTIDWLVKNVPESNGKVGMLGSSYEGFTVVMALVNSHPALKVAAPMSPMVDGWMGDDWFHFGAFRQTNFDYITFQTTAKGEGHSIARQGYDDYENFLRAGSAGDFARAAGLDQNHGCTAIESPDDVDPGIVGPGRHVGCGSLLFGNRIQRHREQHELPGDGPMAP